MTEAEKQPELTPTVPTFPPGPVSKNPWPFMSPINQPTAPPAEQTDPSAEGPA